MGTDINDQRDQPCLSNPRVRIAVAIVFAVFVGSVAGLGGLLILCLGLLIFGSLAYVSRRFFSRGFKCGWLVLGAPSGAWLGSMFVGNCSDLNSQTLESVVHAIEGAILGTLVGIAIDLAKNPPRGRIRIRFGFWYVFAYLWMGAVCIYVIMSLFHLFTLRSTL